MGMGSSRYNGLLFRGILTSGIFVWSTSRRIGSCTGTGEGGGTFVQEYLLNEIDEVSVFRM